MSAEHKITSQPAIGAPMLSIEYREIPAKETWQTVWHRRIRYWLLRFRDTLRRLWR